MGWVAGARLGQRDRERGRARDPRVGDDDLRPARGGDPRGASARTDRPFGVNLRADAEDADARVALLVAKACRSRRSRSRRASTQIKPLKDAGIAVVPSIGARRHAEKVAAWGADAVIVQGGEGGGHTGAVADHAAAAPGRRRGRHPGDRGRRLLRRPRPRRRARVRRGRHRDGHPLPAHAGEHGARRGEAVLPRPQRSPTRSSPTRIDGVPHRVLRTEFVDELEHSQRGHGAATRGRATRSRSRSCRARRGAGCCARASR